MAPPLVKRGAVSARLLDLPTDVRDAPQAQLTDVAHPGPGRLFCFFRFSDGVFDIVIDTFSTQSS